MKGSPPFIAVQSRGYGWGDLKTDPKHMKIMNNEEQRGGWLVIECSPGRKHKNMHIKGFSPVWPRPGPRGEKAHHSVSQAGCCMAPEQTGFTEQGEPSAPHFSKSERPTTVCLSHRPGPSAEFPQAFSSLRAAQSEGWAKKSHCLSFPHPLIWKALKRCSCYLASY